MTFQTAEHHYAMMSGTIDDWLRYWSNFSEAHQIKILEAIVWESKVTSPLPLRSRQLVMAFSIFEAQRIAPSAWEDRTIPEVGV